jgi:(S)-2-hydroxy-acid oxidase
MTVSRLRDSEEAYDRYKIRPRVLVNVDNLDTSTELFAIKTVFPLGFSPAAIHKLAHSDGGEIATSRAAAKFGICMGLSSYATESIKNVAAQRLGNPYAMQFCVLRNRSTTLQIITRAEGALCSNL